MEKQESIGLVEIILKILNNDLRHFKLFTFLVLVPTIAAFVAVMWVIKPKYESMAIVTPPASKSSLGSLSSMMASSMGGMGSLLGIGGSDEDGNAVWTILNSWELHDQVIREFNLAEHYKFKGKFHADLLKEFRKNFGMEFNKEDMIAISIKDEDYHLAAKMVNFMLERADSAFNAFKTRQARQSRIYFQSRLDSCEHRLDSLLKDLTDFQVKNNVYDPGAQSEMTIKYLSELQASREKVGIEMAYEKADRGEDSKRYEQLSKRYEGMSNALNASLKGSHSNIGVLSLKKSPALFREYVRREAEIRIQETLYKLLRQQSEEMQLEEAKMLTNLHVLEPPWENDKKVSPRRGLILMFTVFASFLLASILCSLIEYLRYEGQKGGSVASEWSAFSRKVFFWHK